MIWMTGSNTAMRQPMIWDECGDVWQHDRNLDTGPAGYEVYGQDVATGIYRDGMEIDQKPEQFSDGTVVDGEFRRVTCYVPWEFGYNFFRFLPFNNMNKMYQKYDALDQPGGIRIDSVPPCGNTTNIWDPTLPAFQPNPALYCFKDYLECVRCPDDPKELTWFGGENMEIRGRLFYETHTPADAVSFFVESVDGKVLTRMCAADHLAAGCVCGRLRFDLATAEGGHRHAGPVGAAILTGGRGRVPADADHQAVSASPCIRSCCRRTRPWWAINCALSSAASGRMFHRRRSSSPTRSTTVCWRGSGMARGYCGSTPPLRRNFRPRPRRWTWICRWTKVGREYVYKLPHALPLDPEGWFKISNWQTTKLQGVKDPESPWWEERELWSSRPEAYQPHFRIILKGVSGETLTSSDEPHR
jgi:hypothetical protein